MARTCADNKVDLVQTIVYLLITRGQIFRLEVNCRRHFKVHLK